MYPLFTSLDELRETLELAEEWAWENVGSLSPRSPFSPISKAIIGKTVTIPQIIRIRKKIEK